MIVWWPWLTSKRVAQVCQHQLSFLFHFGDNASSTAALFLDSSAILQRNLPDGTYHAYVTLFWKPDDDTCFHLQMIPECKSQTDRFANMMNITLCMHSMLMHDKNASSNFQGWGWWQTKRRWLWLWIWRKWQNGPGVTVTQGPQCCCSCTVIEQISTNDLISESN